MSTTTYQLISGHYWNFYLEDLYTARMAVMSNIGYTVVAVSAGGCLYRYSGISDDQLNFVLDDIGKIREMVEPSEPEE